MKTKNTHALLARSVGAMAPVTSQQPPWLTGRQLNVLYTVSFVTRPVFTSVPFAFHPHVGGPNAWSGVHRGNFAAKASQNTPPTGM